MMHVQARESKAGARENTQQSGATQAPVTATTDLRRNRLGILQRAAGNQAVLRMIDRSQPAYFTLPGHAYANDPVPAANAGGDVSPADQPPPAPAPCPCNPPILKGEDCASKGKNKPVMDAFTTASNWLPAAQTKVDDFINDPSKRAGSSVAAALTSHFGVSPGSADEVPVARQIAKVISNTLKNITDPLCFHCPDQCAKESEDAKNVAAISPFAWRNTNCYSFCPPFFGLDATTQAKVAIHEMMHSWERMGDAAYENQGSPKYPPVTAVARVTADCYASLIRDLM